MTCAGHLTDVSVFYAFQTTLIPMQQLNKDGRLDGENRIRTKNCECTQCTQQPAPTSECATMRPKLLSE